MLQKILIVLVLLACGGCGRPLVIVPNDIGSRGLMLGEVCRLDGSPVPYADPMVSQSLQVLGMKQEYVTIPFGAGPYKFQYLDETTGGNAYMTYKRIWPIGMDFDIVSKQATSVGLILLDPKHPSPAPGSVATGTGGLPYRLIALDNSAEMASLLQDSRPQLYRSLRQDQPMAPSKATSDPAAIAHVRQTIISTRFQNDLRQGRMPSEYVTGCAGTVGRMAVGSNGQAAFKTLETRTLANLSSCNAVGDRLVCLISREKYLSVTGDRVTHESLPAAMNANSLHAVSKDRLVLIDDSMNIYSSTDNGGSWSKNSGFAFEEPLGRDFRADPKHRFGAHAGANNFYIFSKEMNAAHTRVLQGDYRTGELRNLNLPKADYLGTVRETKAGLYVAPSMTYLAKGNVKFLPAGSDVWQQRQTPSTGCYDLAFPDDAGTNLQLLCLGDAVYNSTDGGVSWQRIFRANSLFASP